MNKFSHKGSETTKLVTRLFNDIARLADATNATLLVSDYSLALSSNGYLLITELCSHEQEWAKKSCGDFWLGFEPDTIKVWAESVQMEKIESVFINQRNGFKTQIHIFKKYKD